MAEPDEAAARPKPAPRSRAAKAPGSDAPKPAPRPRNPKPTPSGDAAPAPKPRTAAGNGTSGSKRTAASRDASARSQSARSAAAKTSRTPAESAAAGSASSTAGSTRRRSTAAKRQQVAAALTTDTTTAEPRRRGAAGAALAAAAGAAAATAPKTDADAVETVEAEVVEAPVVAEAAEAAGEPEVVEAAGEPEAEPVAEVEVEAEPVAEVEDAEPAEAVEASPAASVEPEASVEPGASVEPEASVEPIAPEPAVAVAPGAPADLADLDQDVAEAITRASAAAVLANATPPRRQRTLRPARPAPPESAPVVLEVVDLVKRFGSNTAVDGISLSVRAGSFFGVVGPNGAGKTTTLSMITGLLRPDRGTVHIHGVDAWRDPSAAKHATGVLPDRLRLFDRLTGAQLLYYSGILRGLDARTVRDRSADLVAAFGLEDAIDRLVADYSTGMTKKLALACSLIHAPRLLVLDEPFESVDPVSASKLTEILERYVAGGGTVVLSSHGMDLIERVCDSVAIVIAGRVLAAGTLDEVRLGAPLEDRFVELAGGIKAAEGMEWLHSFSD
ncbi:ATP-binding cassette domain-containing protein [Agromyces sp. MMS24-JH15]|uniref:ABC transporter ATP-binding protein n=1 Tax=Agromyces sp. MMS24-JH15 TaxID=3243765 RepID=UPI003747B0DF